MKIALFVHCFYPDHFYGTETYTLEVARQLRSMGHDAVVVTALFAGEPQADALIYEYAYDGVPVVRIDKNYFPNLSVRDTYFQPAFARPLRDVLERVRPDLIHVTHLINHTAVLLEVARAMAIPLVATLTDFFGFCLNNKLETSDGELCDGPNPSRTNCLACYLKDAAPPRGTRPLLQWISAKTRVRRTAKLLNLAIRLPPLRGTSIERMVDDVKDRPQLLQEMYGAYAAMITPTIFLQKAYRANGITGPMHNMWFGVDLSLGPKPVRPANHVLTFGFIGQISEHKGVDLLIDAFVRLPKGRAQLLIYGNRNQDVEYTSQLNTRSQGFPIRFMDTFPSSEIGRVLDDIDVLVIPSRWYENSPLVMLNALARHTPVVVANVPGLTEFVQHGVNGLHFHRGDCEDLSRNLLSFLDGSHHAAQMSLRTSFPRTSRTMVEELVEIYKQVLTGTGADREHADAVGAGHDVPAPAGVGGSVSL